MAVWELDNPAFASFAFYSSILALKMLLMAPLTGYYRMSRGAFANPEDAKKFGTKGTKTDADVERVRRAHQNDLENIPVFFVIASMYLLTQPSTFLATMLFRVFTLARILHTIFYLNESSLRPLSFLVGELISIFLAGSTLLYLW
uniref:Microsomal glutathione S-transferase 1 n=1 Tax=Eriocheir sinensis TaxID=95602 RepID=A0A976SHN3_ERISI|nr:glutathione S-transferase 9 [Eriocheir sinensis]